MRRTSLATRQLFPGRGVFLGVALVALGVLGGLAGCGSAGASGVSGLTGTPQDCGSVHVAGPGLQNAAQAQQNENCFYQAYQHCTAATLDVTVMGVDTSSEDKLATTPGDNGRCAVKATVTNTIVPSTKTPTPQVYTCTSLTQSSNGLTLDNCGGMGPLTIPSQGGTATNG